MNFGINVICSAVRFIFTVLIIMPAMAIAANRTIDENYTLTGDETVDGVLTVADGINVNLAGFTLTVNGLDGEGTITDATAGELHVVVTSGNIANSTVSLTGNLKLVKKGSGTFTTSKANQSYTGGTVVEAGVIALGTNIHPLGDGNATQTVTLKENTTLNFNGQRHNTACCYNFILHGGAKIMTGATNDRTTRHLGSVELLGNATFQAENKSFLGGIANSPALVTLNGHTFTVVSKGDANIGHIKTLDSGKIVFSEQRLGMYAANIDFRSASVEYSNTGWANLGSLGCSVGDFYYNSSQKTWIAEQNVQVNVYGTYTVGEFRPPLTMQDGSSLDVSNYAGMWDASGTPSPAKYTQVSTSGLVTFLSTQASYDVEIGERNIIVDDIIMHFANGYSPDASVVFNLKRGGVLHESLKGEVKIVDGGTYLVAKSSIPYARWVIDTNNPQNSGWKFYNPEDDSEDLSWDKGVTSDVEVRIYSVAEHLQVKSQNVSPVKYTFVGTFRVPDDIEEWDLTSCFDGMSDGSMIDIAGKKLILSDVNFFGTITNSTLDTTAPGELCVVVGGESTIRNETTLISGNLRLVKKGAGTLYMSKPNQSYTGGTIVEEGTLILGTAEHPLGDGNATQRVTVYGGATFNAGTVANSTKCAYNFVLKENSNVIFGATSDRAQRRFGDLYLEGDANITTQGKSGFIGLELNYSTITLNGNTLSLQVVSSADSHSRYVRTVGDGIIKYVKCENNGMQNQSGETDFGSARVEYAKDAFVHLGDSGVTVGDFVYNGNKWKAFGEVRVRVKGEYEVGAFRPPIEMLHGSTLNLVNITMPLNAGGVKPSDTGNNNVNSSGELVFSDGAEVTVRLDGRTDLWEFVRGDNPYVIKWDSAPNAVFLLDEVTYKNGFRIHADSTGVKLANHAGFKVIIR